MARAAQKDRTRHAILDGARQLLARGETVTVVAAAEVHGISRATAYRYFSDPAVLTAEAVLDLSVLDYEEVVAGAEDLRSRLMAISGYFFDLAVEHEPTFRQYLSLNLAAWQPDKSTLPTRRGARRVVMYRRALSEAGDPLDDATAERLVNALTVGTGIEAMIALYDIALADRQAARIAADDIAGALIDRFLPPAT
ncbi:TetR/AcrR family transcriptional regulator [Pelagovum pacificum]|uniref:TetR/AcrR family transcriptional regulator n=1 Tax=Pelagovum pacificum TaxID=2588711 RepID=A0A5C5GCA3_9RHOB|nr:hypothetical protein [Pelagovum pacificum]QQA44440.1 hypothetical protein I8N54_07685 [Pelagovum pacificum]TNY32442.1 hypothetical protein FHY64_03890 [Pelagovum pacificum]